MPTFAALIMATSLAPSPMARVHEPGTPNLIRLSICAFWSLRARHATTEKHACETAVSTSAQSVAQYSIAFSSSTRHRLLSEATSCEHTAACIFVDSGVAFVGCLTQNEVGRDGCTIEK
eukprot:6183166-Pleurochrysis_carterae.AAC.3